jgi:recombination protein RecA
MASFLEKANKKVKKTYGADVMYVGSKLGNFLPLSTGFLTIDWGNSGIGGFPRGGITLIHGMESTGKSTLVLEAIAFAQEEDKEFICLYVDVENSLTEDFLQFKGVDPSRIVISSLNNEDALVQIEDAIKENIFDMIVIDSLAKLESTKILEKDLGESGQRNRRAVIITEFLRRISYILRKSKTALVMINQEVQNQDTSPWAPKTILPCGFQQRFSSNLILSLKRKGAIKDGKRRIGYELTITSTKCKISDHERVETTLLYIFDHGFLRTYAVIDYLVMVDIIKKLTAGRYEFIDKTLCSEVFKPKDITRIAAELKNVKGVDLHKIRPDNVEFKKVDATGEPNEESDLPETTMDAE